MKITKESLKQIIKEELAAVMEDSVVQEGGKAWAYYNQSMIGAQVELNYDGKSVDFQYRYAGSYANQVRKAIESLANRGRIGDIAELPEAIVYYLKKGGMTKDVPTVEQIAGMPVHFG
tara:strand:+ start:149 stop:502 length:354 start_codon:yes stop_codon:yes gene_type:complete